MIENSSTSAMTTKRLKELLEYEASTGEVRRKSSGRVLSPDFAGFVSIYDPAVKKTTKMKLKNAIWLWMGYDIFPAQVVFQKNMQEEDYSLKNICIVSKSTYVKVKEAYKNINESIRLTQHPIDMFSNVLHWYQDGAGRSKVIGDIIVAKREMLKLKLYYSKILTTYCVFD